ncbi:hypothetical protein GCM10022254_03970 [Actinomadura meridiana]|uniref:Transport permease protein n=1 Tax=Actinomadura meridiana TaxID=559626 RepID=A0ABP8BSA0_9ACTN
MFSPHRTGVVTHRIVKEFLRDPRSRVVLVVTPGLLLVIVPALFESATAFNPSGVMMIGLFPAMTMTLVGSASIVRERTRGSLESILATPVTRPELVLGYVCAGAVLAAAQSVVTTAVAYWVSDISTASPPWLLGLLAMCSGMFGMCLGLLISAACANEGQAFQFMPGVMIPQMLVTGIVWPVAQMADWVQWLERALPLSTVTRAMTAAREHSYGGTSLVTNLIAMLAVAAGALAFASLFIRRRTA